MFSKIMVIISVLVLLSAGFEVENTAAGPVTRQEELAEMELISENRFLQLYQNEKELNFAIREKKTGEFWLSNPVERHQERGYHLASVSSQLNITHDPDQTQKNNYQNSIQFEQYEVELIDGGLRVDFTFVEEWSEEHYVPKLISRESFSRQVLDRISEPADRNLLLEEYYLFQLTERTTEKKLQLGEISEEEIFGDYTLKPLGEEYGEHQQQLKELQEELDRGQKQEGAEIEAQIEDITSEMESRREELMWHLLELIEDKRTDIDSIYDIQEQDVIHLVDTPTYMQKEFPIFVYGDLYEVIEPTGFTPLEVEEAHQLNNIDPPLDNLEIFQIPVEYRLKEDSFIVRIDCSKIQYPEDVVDLEGEQHNFPLLTIDVLPFLSAGGIESEGYSFIPDGSGALIYHNNEKTYTSPYNQPVYGPDHAVGTAENKIIYGEQINLPVFGQKLEDRAFLGVIEEGAALARINADIAGIRNDYNRVFPAFNVIPRGTIELEAEDTGYIEAYQSRIYQGDIKIRYKFLSGPEADYSGMARAYRGYYVKQHDLQPLESVENLPLVLEMVGSFPRQMPVLGISREVEYPLTDYKGAFLMLKEFKETGINNMFIRYSGLFEGSLEHYYPGDLELTSVLGDRSELNEFLSYAEKQGWNIYPHIALLNVYRDRLLDGFNPRRHSARQLNRRVAQIHEYDLATYRKINQDYRYVLAPGQLGKLTDDFLEDFSEYDFEALSLQYVGHQVNSDFRDDEQKLVDREQSRSLNLKLLERLYSEQGLDLMTSGGNDYVLPYMDILVDISLDSSAYNIFDRRIPFFQMVFHGYLNYAGEPMNLARNYEENLLLALETGALPFYKFSYEDTGVLKETDFAHLFSLNYEDWLDKVQKYYQQADELLSELHHLKIQKHKKLQDNVFQTVYENDTVVIINYNNHPVTVEDREIGARDFLKIKAGEIY